MHEARRLLGVLIAVSAMTLGACGSGGGDRVSPSGTSATSTTTTAPASTTTTAPFDVVDDPLPGIVGMDAAGALAITAEPAPDWVSIAGGAAWVANVGGGIRRYDVTTGAELGTVPVPGAICLAMDVGFDSLWAGDCDNNTVVRIDLKSGQVLATIDPDIGEIAAEASLAVDDKGVYVLSNGAARKVARIDPVTNAVAKTFAAPPGSSAVRAAFGALWFSQSGTGTLTKVDPSSGSTLATAAAGKGAGFLATGEGSIWVLNNFDGTVTRVDPSGVAIATITVDDGLVEGGDIAVGGGFVWARVSSAVVAQIDPATNKVVARFGEPSGSGSVAADDGVAWISAHDVHTVWRLPVP